MNFHKFVQIYNKIDVEITWLIFLLVVFSLVLIFLKIFGKVGLYIYTAIAIVAANIQVLKIVNFPFFDEPIALGTVLFASTFLCTDILAEHYGIKSARKNILLGFSAFLLMTILMLFTLGFKPISEFETGENYIWALSIQENLLNIFLPFPIFFIASMLAYLTSQFFDVWFFDKISKFTNKRFLWLRNNLSTVVSSFIDNSIFSMFAWIILNPNPLDFDTVIFTYILGTFILRIFIALFDTPFIYLSKFFLPKNINE